VLLSLGAGGDDVTDFYLAVIHDHAINEQLHQLPRLGEVQLLKSRLEVLAEGFDIAGQLSHFGLPMPLSLQLAELLGQASVGLNQFLMFALKLVTADDLGQIDSVDPILVS
jgi:hypothetical protein